LSSQYDDNYNQLVEEGINYFSTILTSEGCNLNEMEDLLHPIQKLISNEINSDLLKILDEQEILESIKSPPKSGGGWLHQ
jgi:hypothetical protein